jgi:GWxTD domain-containing protein
MRPRTATISLVLALSLLGVGGDGALGAQKLKPEYEEFLSQVSYIITSAERKEFLALPDSKRPEFIEKFWKSRDPDPSTEKNEFKDEYLGRVSKAGRLFFGEGRPGWLTDRGRIYVLFGPPDQRSATSAGAESSGRCQEVWYYRDFPVVFIDGPCTGTFRLATLDLSPIADLSLIKESAPKPLLPSEEKPSFDFEVILKKKKPEGMKLDILVEILMPFSAIWLNLESGRFVASLEIQLSLKDSQGVLRWEHSETHDLSLTSEELKQKMKSNYELDIPLSVEKDVEALNQGKNKLLIVIKNKKIGEEIRKTVEFSL